MGNIPRGQRYIWVACAHNKRHHDCVQTYLVGERLRDFLYGEPVGKGEAVPEGERIPGNPQRKQGQKWKRYSGLFVLLKQKWSLSARDWERIVEEALAIFTAIVLPVPTRV